jgi:hypothetical protein
LQISATKNGWNLAKSSPEARYELMWLFGKWRSHVIIRFPLNQQA